MSLSRYLLILNSTYRNRVVLAGAHLGVLGRNLNREMNKGLLRLYTYL